MSELLLIVRKDSDPPDQWTRLSPDTYDLQVPENESLMLEFRGHNAHLLETKNFEYIGSLRQLDARWPMFSWRPFDDGRKVAYGWQRLQVHLPQSDVQQSFFVQVIPSLLNLEQWKRLFEDVRRVADALVTKWLSTQNTYLGGVALHSSKFSPATAMAEMQKEWDDFAASLGRILRAPRTEFRVPHPSRVHMGANVLPEPIRDANTYENALVALTVERLVNTLRRIERRAKSSMRNAEETREIYKDVYSYSGKGPDRKKPHAAMLEAQEIYDNSQRIAIIARERAQLLQRHRRKLPGQPHVAASRGRIPHITPRIHYQPDYKRVIQWYRSFGHQQVAFAPQQFLSALGAKRASTLYEYWCLLAMFSSLAQLGFTPDYQQISEFVREDVLDLTFYSDRPIRFTGGDGAETLTIWYERQARFLPGKTTGGKPKNWKADVKAACAALAPPGLYSRQGPQEPDFWFELSRGEQVAVAVGDAIFSEGVDSGSQSVSSFMINKMKKVATYVDELALIDANGCAHFPIKGGLVVFCGYFASCDLLDEHNSSGHTLLPLRPEVTVSEECNQSIIPLNPQSIQTFAAFLQELRDDL